MRFKYYSHKKYVCTIFYGDKTMHTDIYSISWPSHDSILCSLVSYAEAGVYDAFEDFCLVYGYNDDSIKDLRIYEGCRKTYLDIHNLFGDELAQSLIASKKDL